MADPIISFIPQNDKEFKALLDKVGKQVSDFRVPFGLIANHFYRGNKKIFLLKGPGLYPVLGGFNPGDTVNFRGNTVTKQKKAETLKKEQVGFIYPLLKRRGDIQKSLTSKNDKGAEFFVGRNTLIMGTKVPHAKFHQSDSPRKSLPQRKLVFIDGGPAETSKDALISGRAQAWANIIRDYVAQVISGSAKV